MSVPACFRMPRPVKITGRISSITNSFVNGVIPAVHPAEEEVAEALAILGLDADDLRCAYCSDAATEWDHFRPIVTGQRPTGFISEIANLVPACGKCNQSKGATYWKDWMTGSARQSPATRQIPDLQSRISRLENFEAWRRPTTFDLEEALGPDLWARYWSAHDHLVSAMRECEVTAEEARQAVRRYARD